MSNNPDPLPLHLAHHCLAAGASTKREKTPQMIMRLVREKVQKNTAFKESTLALTPQLLAGRIYIDRLHCIVYLHHNSRRVGSGCRSML